MTGVDTNKRVGLDEDAVARSRRQHGENRLTRKKQRGFWLRFLSNLGDPVIRILLGALILKLFLLFEDSDRIETAGIAVAVFLAALISTISEYGSARAFEKLNDAGSGTRCRVRRGGRVREILPEEIVVGDILLLGAGESVPADGLLYLGEVRLDQSAMTGESREVRKVPSPDRSMSPSSPSALLRGCNVTSGSCEMEVCAVGDATFLGGISSEIQEETRESPLKLRLAKLARQISVLGYIAAALVAFAYLFNNLILDSGMHWELIRLKCTDWRYLSGRLLGALTLGLTVLVVAVPEGLPMMIAVVLSSNIRKMLRDNVLVRKPVGIEAAGSMNILFTDKTGTLTEGRMRVGSCILPDGANLPFSQLSGRGDVRHEWMRLCILHGVDAVVGADEGGRLCALGGSATERALLDAILPAPKGDTVRVLSRLAFDSSRKYSAVSLRRGTERVTLLMGAPERLLPHVVRATDMSGRAVGFARVRMEQALRERTSKGERVLAFALADSGTDAGSFANGIHGSLTLLGALSLCDPLRPEAAHAVAQLQDAGIQVVMMTGDNRDTAAHLASQCGILTPKHNLVLDGEALAKMSDDTLRTLLPRLAVLSRALPTDKSRLIRLSQEMGLVSGMTGDGINDAPALRRADIGFAMGSGTQVAKDAGDIIILDNNLASIVKAVLYGRTIFKSIRKFITLQLTMNFCALGVTMICPFLGIDSPVTVVQMLWINMIMDTLGGLAFAGEAPLADYMREPPKRRDEPILNRYMVNQILVLGGFTVSLFLFFLKSPTITSVFRPHESNLHLLTAFFALFIFSSVYNCFNARTDRLKITSGLRRNHIFLCIMAAVLAIQLVFVYLGGSVLRTAPPTPLEMLVTMALSLAVFPADLIRKALWRLRGRKEGY